MITKEYRIPMPLGVEEYRIAQLYMIAKKSRLESEGEGSGVEIIKNEPYMDGPGGSGQYTDKLYHIAAHLPVWLRAFLPKSLSTIREEAWNAYPYSGTKQDNVFNLNQEDLQDRVVDIIDFVNEKLYGADNVPEEDPLTYKSSKTSRGPLDENWLISKNNSNEETDGDKKEKESDANSSKKDEEFMCVYKICRVNFNRWPVQYKVEQFIHDYIRKTLVRAHRQAWAWQDEWHGLSMEQVREMERETQESLSKMMKKEEVQ